MINTYSILVKFSAYLKITLKLDINLLQYLFDSANVFICIQTLFESETFSPTLHTSKLFYLPRVKVDTFSRHYKITDNT